MNWREVVARWLAGKGVILGGELKIMELVELMIGRNMIPAWLADNATLHTVLLTQVMWETLKGIVVPRAPQPDNFTYHMNAKEMMNEDLARKSGQQFLALEKETGVNLDCYYKLEISSKGYLTIVQIHLHFGFYNEWFRQEASSDRNNICQDHCTWY